MYVCVLQTSYAIGITADHVLEGPVYEKIVKTSTFKLLAKAVSL